MENFSSSSSSSSSSFLSPSIMSVYVAFSIVFLILSVLFCLFLMAVNILILIQIVPGTTTVAGGMNIVLRIFTIILALLSVAAKKETQVLSTYLLLIEGWVGNGILDVLYDSLF